MQVGSVNEECVTLDHQHFCLTLWWQYYVTDYQIISLSLVQDNLMTSFCNRLALRIITKLHAFITSFCNRLEYTITKWNKCIWRCNRIVFHDIMVSEIIWSWLHNRLIESIGNAVITLTTTLVGPPISSFSPMARTTIKECILGAQLSWWNGSRRKPPKVSNPGGSRLKGLNQASLFRPHQQNLQPSEVQTSCIINYSQSWMSISSMGGKGSFHSQIWGGRGRKQRQVCSHISIYWFPADSIITGSKCLPQGMETQDQGLPGYVHGKGGPSFRQGVFVVRPRRSL